MTFGLSEMKGTEDFLAYLIGFILIGAIPGQIAVRAMVAAWRLRRKPWRRGPAGIRSAIAELPRDRRLVQALSPLVASLMVYAAGLIVAVLVGLAAGMSC